MSELIIKKYKDYILKDKGLSQNTSEAYIRDILQFEDYLTKKNIDDLIKVNKTIVITYLMELQREGRAVSTISRKLASIRCFYQHLLNNNIIKEDPTLNLQSPKPERKLPNILTKEEVELLLDQPSQENYKGIRDKAMLELLYATGIKVSEIVSLNLGNLNLDSGYLNISELNKRVIPIGSIALKHLKNYITFYRHEMLKDNKEPALFLNYNGNRLTRQGFWKIIKGYTSNLDIDKKITPQTLRNSFAVHLLENGADIKMVQEMMGHSDVSTTQVYSFAINNNNTLEDVYKNTHPRA